MNKEPSRSSVWQILTLAILLFASVFLLVGGIWLAALGGSLYYAITGIILLIVTILYKKRSPYSVGLYALLLIATVIWGLWEAGSDFWALAPRYDIIFLLGLWLILRPASSRFARPLKLSKCIMIAGLIATLAVLGYSIFNDPQEVHGVLKNPAEATPTAADNSSGKDWLAYGGSPGGARYSSLNQINTENIGKLKEVWRFQTKDVKTSHDPVEITNEVTPIKVGDSLYLCSAHQKLFALDAATGKEKWMFDPKTKSEPSFQHMTCRGVSYHAAKADSAESAESKSCPRKVLLPTNDGRLFAINADNGQPCEGFGDNGMINLQANMPNSYPGGYEPTSPPVVTDKVIIIGGAVTDNYSVTEPSGVIRGYDVNNGKLLWVFDLGASDPNKIPQEGENFTANSPNSWAPSSYDPKLDLVYIPTGVQTPDIWGGNRTPDMERYASSILALNATTGKLVWAYQTVHHDLWDMDVPSQPSLVDIKDKDGNLVPAIYAPTKTGNIFVLDRRNGKLIVPAPEKPVPQGAAKGDHLSPTQPFSELSYRPQQGLSEKNMWGGTMFDQLSCRIQFRSLRYEGIFTPPSEQGSLIFPGNLGMFEWGGISVNQDRQVALSNPMALPFVSKLVPRGPKNPMWPPAGTARGTGSEAGVQPQYGTPYGVELAPFLSKIGVPCKEPAWGYVSALDLKTHEVIWKKRIGTIRDSIPGLQLPPVVVGMPMLGGPISTAGNLMFIGASQDNYLRAYNIENGDQVWETRLPAGGQATPMTYEANGKQYVVISAGGHGSFGTTMGDYIVAYALSDDK